ncbi:AI-2E family transporter [Gordonia sp. ABSL49_1]|uniref:AI-2E family transporter n=1 Tax=unclassified Gordonia (in: high G+C Gram-positive bacteria) TaxID=2657482 RepID=UPI001F0FE4D3|nr:AI-2E family transporter [Gordonia sp. ABSL49_1]MCH5645336.1 AI-2E family transporter [Gordonia sp. ABSL49_1]
MGAESSTTTEFPSRGKVMMSGLRSSAIVGLEIILVVAAVWVLMWVLAKLWVVLLPILFAIILCTILWPPVRWMRQRGVPAAAASIVMMLVAVGVFAGVIGAIVPSIVDQAPDLANRATDGVKKLQDWIQGPPLNVQDEQLDNIVHTITQKLQSSSTTIAQGVFSGVGTATSALVTIFTTLVLVFFFLKDGPKFVPWLHRTLGKPSGLHVGEVLQRMWASLGGFIRTQALVSFVDAALIGVGLVILDVPLAGVLIVVTFLGGFIPIVGAFVAGALAVLIALVSNGLTSALILLGVILAVQQLEGNVLQPWLQSKSMDLHATIVLLSVTLGGTLFGITGAFLAVPAASAIAVVLRYLNEQIAARAGETLPPEGMPVTEQVGVPDEEPPPDTPAGAQPA